MIKSNPKIITFVSGKGGSGKTTVSISMSQLLTVLRYRCLLIDFDLATNGGSYFFLENFPSNSKGIHELLNEQQSLEAVKTLASDLPIEIKKDQLFFVASRAKTDIKSSSDNNFIFDKDFLNEGILTPLLNWAKEKNIHYVLIDCQAGYTTSVMSAIEVASRVIIVTEPDPISNDAADNLLVQVGKPLLEKRYYLVNKLDIRELKDYQKALNLFQSLNRLPPLPLDPEVRNAFHEKRIPLEDINKPSPLLFALFETLKAILKEPSEREKIKAYQEQRIDAIFEKYTTDLKVKIDDKNQLELQRVELIKKRIPRQYKLIKNILFVVFLILILLISRTIFDRLLMKSLLYKQLFTQNIDVLLWSSIGVILILVAIDIFKLIRTMENQAKNELKAEELAIKIEEINREIDRFRSLLLTKYEGLPIPSEIISGDKT